MKDKPGPKHLDTKYVAGLFDGEGSVCCYGPRHELRVNITNSYEPILLDLKHQFRGTVCILHRPGQGKAKRLTYSWSASNRIAAHFLSVIQYHVHIKTNQVKVGLALQSTMRPRIGKGIIPASILRQRERLWQRLKCMNH